MEIKNVVFDFGGVLLDWSPFYVYDDYFGSHQQAADFIENVCTPQWNSTMDAGTTFEEAVTKLSKIFPEWQKEIRMYKDRWPDMLKGQIDDGVRLLEDVRQSGRYRLFGLTNWSHETFHYAQDNYPFLSYFEDIVVSGRVRMIKPDPGIFRYLLEHCKINPHETLFIDDSGKNILAAKDLGFITVHFNEPAKGAARVREVLGLGPARA